jgi:7,8-dihydro-6-hydroxymethylpterin-pyrophosphokinase
MEALKAKLESQPSMKDLDAVFAKNEGLDALRLELPKLDASERLAALSMRLETCEKREIPDHRSTLEEFSKQIQEICGRERNYIANQQLQQELTRLYTQLQDHLNKHTLR